MKTRTRLFDSTACLLSLVLPVSAITFTPFGPHGEGGVRHGQSVQIGSGGTVHELDGFVRVGGLDLNGAQPGDCAQLSRDNLPAGLDLGVSAVLTNANADLVVRYALTNLTGGTLSNVTFFVLLDAEIDEPLNTFFNERAVAQGALGGGAADGNPDQWQIGEPGFQGGTLYSNLVYGALNNSNGIAGSDDVALALGFSLGPLRAGESNVVQVMISEAGHHLGDFWLTQQDSAVGSATTVTLSGAALVTQEPAKLEWGLRQWQLDLSTCIFRATVGITNTVGSGPVLGPTYYLGLQPTPDYVYVSASGVLSNGFPYVDLSALVSAQVSGGLLAPGQYVILSNAVAVYSLDGGQQQQNGHCTTNTPPPAARLFLLEAAHQ
jgi:hypothetical protein